MQVKKATAIGVLATAAIGIAILLTAVPAERRLKVSLDDRHDPETVRYGRELLDSSVARFLDPDGHDRLEKALEIRAGTRALDGFRIDHDATIATDFHRIAIHQARVLGLAALALIFAGGLIGFVLWIGDRRSGWWLGAGPARPRPAGAADDRALDGRPAVGDRDEAADSRGDDLAGPRA
jgi:hypothetical protein